MPSLKTYIVEDSPVIRENLIATLEELSPVRVVGHADDEHGAVQWLVRPENEADLVIVDLFLRSGSGLGVLRGSASFMRRRRIVVLSNYTSEPVRRQCLALGAARVFDKSNDIEALLAYCDEVAASQSGPAGSSLVA
jgi:DNA-binding NarL/FixJ family response regulator